MVIVEKIKKALNVLFPTYYDEDEDYKLEADFPHLRGRSFFGEGDYAEEDESERRDGVVSIHATTQLKVVLLKPVRFENASEIADHIKEKRTVVLNLESVKKETARRLVDFISGVVYASEGSVKKVATNTYIITPYNVDIMGDLIDELESSGWYF